MAVETPMQRVGAMFARLADDLPRPGNRFAKAATGPVQAFRGFDPTDRFIDNISGFAPSP